MQAALADFAKLMTAKRLCRLCQEQQAGKSMISKHRDLQSQMLKVKQAVLALSE